MVLSHFFLLFWFTKFSWKLNYFREVLCLLFTGKGVTINLTSGNLHSIDLLYGFKHIKLLITPPPFVTSRFLTYLRLPVCSLNVKECWHLFKRYVISREIYHKREATHISSKWKSQSFFHHLLLGIDLNLFLSKGKETIALE